MRLHSIVRAALLACCASAAVAQAGQSSLTFPVRLQVLSTCRVSAPPHNGLLLDALAAPGVPASALLIRCSRKTPFAVALSAPAGPGVAATGTGMGRVSAALPTGEPPASGSIPAPVTVHVSY